MKTALITGGSSGIGLSFAVKLLREGYQVVLLSRDGQKLQSAVENLNQQGFYNVSYVKADVRDLASLQAAFSSGTFNGLDLVIHSAGILRVGDKATMQSFHDCMETNMQGTQNVLEVVTPLLQKSKGRIAVLCSIAGLINFPGYADYGASKKAQRLLCEEARHELEWKGVGLTMVYPSTIRTPMVTNIQDQLPPIARLIPWLEADRVVETFYTDIRKGRKESYVSFADRVTYKVAMMAPKAFLFLIKGGMKLKGLK
jgi:NAD(P)-dependent dehydrogenase (short-subunit alcohol dehydrogenase family)